MQSLIRVLIISTLLSGLVHIPAMGQLVVCPGEPVQFELQDAYYGVKTWEHSVDSTTWAPASVVESAPFIITPELAGWYRVSFHDEECGLTYYSNVVRLAWREPLQLNSVFTEQVIPAGVDPVLWLSDPDGLSNVVYVVNGVEHPSTLLYQSVPNPGVGFTVFAFATDALGCTVISDTLTFFVEDTNILGNGVLQPEADVDLTSVLVNSSVDTAALGMGNAFSLNYNLDFIHDLIIAYREVGGGAPEVVALRLALAQEEYLLMNERTTAWSMVFAQPDIIHLAIDSADALRSWLESRTDFATLEGAIRNDLEQLGFVVLSSSEKTALVNALVFQILNEWLDGERDGGDGMYPILGGLAGIGATICDYDHSGINLVYGARVYKDGQPVSSTILFRGEGSELPSSTVLNYAIGFMQFAPFTPPFRDSNIMTMSELQIADAFAAIDVLLTNGKFTNGVGGMSGSSALQSMAGRYNDLVFCYRFLSSLPLAQWRKASTSTSGTGGFSECLGGVGSDAITEALETAYSQTSETQWTTTMNALRTQVRSGMAECIGDAALTGLVNTTSRLFSVATLQGIGWQIQYFYDRYTRESDVIYRFTKVNGNFHGSLVVEDNSAESFVSIAGSFTHIKPRVQIKERQWHVRKPTGTMLALSEPVPYGSSLVADGFTFLGLFGSLTNTQQVGLHGQTYTGPALEEAPIHNEENEFTWKIANSPSSAVANLHVYIRHQGIEVPAHSMEGYNQGHAPFEAAIEEPDLTITLGSDTLSGPPSQALSSGQCCGVRLTASPSGIPIDDYPVIYEVVEGGGSTAFVPGLNTYSTFFDGVSGAQWTLGEIGPQQMLARVAPAGVTLDEVEFQAQAQVPVLLGMWKMYAYNDSNYTDLSWEYDIEFEVAPPNHGYNLGSLSYPGAVQHESDSSYYSQQYNPISHSIRLDWYSPWQPLSFTLIAPYDPENPNLLEFGYCTGCNPWSIHWKLVRQ